MSNSKQILSVGKPDPEMTSLHEVERLAKLLATENITIEHSTLHQTASFDLDRRILMLPSWSECVWNGQNFIDRNLYHMLVGHETGHAIFTPKDKWESSAKQFGEEFQAAMNVVEDARIDKMIQRRYPGLRTNYRLAAEKMKKEDFFKIAGKDIASLPVMDRINLHFKMGLHDSACKIPFHSTELKYLNKIAEAETFEEVLRLTKWILKDSKEKQENYKKGQGQAQSKSQDQGQGQGQAQSKSQDQDQGQGQAQSQDQDQGQGQAQSQDQDQIDREIEEKSWNNSAGAGAGVNQQTVQEEFNKTLLGMIGSKFFPNPSYVELVQPSKKVLGAIVAPYQNILRYYSTLGSLHTMNRDIRKDLLPGVNLLLKEFMMKKAASGYRRQQESKTGTINPNKLSSYKIAEDIFRRNTIMPVDKNHGLVMFVDFSGSMNFIMKETLEQVFTLVLFCRKANIPHRVYAFLDCKEANYLFDPSARLAKAQQNTYVPPSAHESQKIQRMVLSKEKIILDNTSAKKYVGPGREVAVPGSHLVLAELFSEKMRNSENTAMMDLLGQLYFSPSVRLFGNHHPLALGGTPLNETIIASSGILRDFKEETKAEIVSAVYLTDGVSSGSGYIRYISEKTPSQLISSSCRDPSYSKYVDRINGRIFSVSPDSFAKRSVCETEIYLNWIRSLGYATIGYHVGYSYSLCSTYGNVNISTKNEVIWSKSKTGKIKLSKRKSRTKMTLSQILEKEKSYSLLNTAGYDQLGLLLINNRYNASTPEDDEKEKKTYSRKILMDFISTISSKMA